MKKEQKMENSRLVHLLAHRFADILRLARDAEFNKLFAIWIENEYNTIYTPSINRIDSNRGYVLDNMQWLTHQENSRKGVSTRYER